MGGVLRQNIVLRRTEINQTNHQVQNCILYRVIRAPPYSLHALRQLPPQQPPSGPYTKADGHSHPGPRHNLISLFRCDHSIHRHPIHSHLLQQARQTMEKLADDVLFYSVYSCYDGICVH
jgi:hypothetical protein